MYNKTRQFLIRKFTHSQNAIERAIKHLDDLARIYSTNHKEVTLQLLDIRYDLENLIDNIDDVRQNNNL